MVKKHTFSEFTCSAHHTKEREKKKSAPNEIDTAAKRNIVMGFDWKEAGWREKKRHTRCCLYTVDILGNVNKRNEQMIRKRVSVEHASLQVTNIRAVVMSISSSSLSLVRLYFVVFHSTDLLCFAFWSCFFCCFSFTPPKRQIHLNSKVVADVFFSSFFQWIVCTFCFFIFVCSKHGECTFKL